MFHEIILDGIIKSNNGPLAQRTQLGWILSGPTSSINKSNVQNAISLHTQVNIDNSLRKFWELEEISVARSSSPEDAACEAYFQSTDSRSSSGRYMVKLPFKSKVLGEDYRIFEIPLKAH